jgi:PAS domain S-box-containing protein
MIETESEGCILVAGTQSGRLETLRALLAQHGYGVRRVNGGSLVVNAARESQPDLILLDTALSGGDSYQACKLLKANPDTRDIPVILVLDQPNHGWRLDRSRAFAAGAADYVTTPFQEQEVLARVQTQLALAAMRNQLAEKDAQLEHACAERTEVEQALQEAEEARHDLLGNLSDVIYTTDRDGILTYISPAVESFLGYTPSEVEGRHIGEFIHAHDLERLGESFARVLTGQHAANEYRVLTKAGEVRWMRASSQPAYARPLGARGGQLIGVQGVLADITESKRAEEQIQKQNEFLTSVLESLTHPFYVLNAHDYTVQIANSAARHGRKPGQATCYALTHARNTPCGSDSHPCTVEEIKRTKEPVKVEHIHYDAQGHARHVEVHGYPLLDKDGHVTQVIEYALDITERKQAEEALQESEKRYRQLLDTLQEGIWVIDQDARTTFVNPRMAEMLGYTVEEMQGKHLFSFMDERGIEIAQRNLQRRQQGIAEQHDFEFLRQDGSRLFALLETSPIHDEDGNYVGAIAGIQDITERRQAEQAIQKSESLLTETQRMARVGGWELNLDTSEVVWTGEVYRIHEVPTDFEPMLENALAFYDPEDRPLLEQAIQRASETGEPWDLELRFITAKGNRLWVRAIGNAERQDGRVVRLSGTFQDITERKQAEQALRESEARWRSVTETSPDHVMLLDRDLVIQFVNRASPGLTVDELIGTPLYAYVSKERQGEIKQILEGVLDTAEPCSYETEFSTPDGYAIYYESRVVPRFIDDQVVGLAVTARDITAHKRAERALQEASEAAEQARLEEWERRQEADRRRRIAESLADVLAALNSNQPLDQVLDFIALQARHLLDSHAVAIYRQQDTAGTLALQAAKGLPAGCIAGTDTPPGLGALRQAVGARQPVLVPDAADSLPDGAPSAQYPEELVTEATGSVFCRALLAMPILVQDEVYGGMLLYYAEARSFSGDELELAAVFGDQVALAIENARLREQVEQAAATAERSRLARDLHDSVTQALFSASLVAEVLPKVWQRDPEEAQQGLEELRHLTRGALAEMRTLLLELRPSALLETRLDDLLRQLTEAITSRAQLLATLHIEPSPLLPPDVHVTFYRVTQEALHNAVKHAGANHVTVSLQASPPPVSHRTDDWLGQIELRVIDDGQGFDPGQRDPHHLGLGIMHERAANVGARLAIESQPSQGTQVILIWQNTP